VPAENKSNGRPATAPFDQQRAAMVEQQIRRRGITAKPVLDAMLAVPRHEFVPPGLRTEAYADKPLAIGEGQTISQPFIVATMSAALELNGTERVLEVGTGCGYQTAVLALLAREVWSIEVHATLAQAARARLERLGYTNVHVEIGDGTLGWPEAAPFDAILVTAAAPAVPAPLTDQLSVGGRMVIPVGSMQDQELRQIRKTENGISERGLCTCRFVPLAGRYGWHPLS
jgi:protein-L-isoaspartate(D-aspartate) O-methyltransferase